MVYYDLLSLLDYDNYNGNYLAIAKRKSIVETRSTRAHKSYDRQTGQETMGIAGSTFLTQLQVKSGPSLKTITQCSSKVG